jgi:excinuclease ABC subunit C
MRYAITGATGFVGGVLARQLRDAGHGVVALVRDPAKAGALGDLGVELTGERAQDVIGLAKEREDASGAREPDRVFVPGAKDPIRLRPNTTELFLLARVRDEAHRFANTFHRDRRKRATLRSALDDIPGIGEKRRRELFRHFGSLKAMRAASEDELAAVNGMSRAAAAALHRFFEGQARGDNPSS